MSIMSALVWYVIPGLIGRSYNLRNESVGPDLFDLSVAKNARVIDQYMTTSEYRVVTDVTEATDFLDVSGKLALKLKTGGINIEGVGSYLKQTESFQNRVDLLVKVHFETVTVTLPSEAKPLPDWEKSIERTGDTHYIRSITYGGDLIASVSFATSNELDREYIKGEIHGELSSKSGSFGGGLKGSLERIENNTRDSASMTINYFATVPLENIPRTIEGLVEIVEKFPEQTKKVNNGWGVPLKMEIFSLEGLSKEINTYYQTMAFSYLLAVLDEQFTDVRTARRRLNDWMHSIPPLLSDEMNLKISEFSSKLQDLGKIFSEVISNLDLSNDASPAQFDPAFKAYQDTEGAMYPDMYVTKLSNLKVEVLSNTPAFEADFGGAIYTYWGGKECPPAVTLTSNGTIATTVKNSVGSTQFLCLPEVRDYIPAKDNAAHDDEDIEDLPQIQPIVFISQGNEKSNSDGYNVDCATCRVPGKTSVTMLPGEDKCPPGWIQQYQGVLVSTEYIKSGRGELICLDVNKDFNPAIKGRDNTVITEVSPSCKNFPCSSASVSDDKALACVVCSIRKETKSMSDVFRLRF